MERKRPAINLSLFTTFSSPPNPTKSPRSFENGVVGLGIVAAMTNFSDKLSVVSCAKATANFRSVLNLERENGVCDDNQVDGLDCDDVDDDGESYTCVISHVGDKLISKRVYFGDRMNDGCGVFDVNVVIGDVKEEFVSEGFLTSCDLCKKLLQGLDIFMYRGENAFCSLECREKHIRNDYKEKCGSEARKSLDYSVSPRSSPLTFFAGVVAA